MAKLTKAARAKLPKSKFAGPHGSFPVEDRKHAKAAILDAPAAERAGHITPMQKAMIDRKARKELGKTNKSR